MWLVAQGHSQGDCGTRTPGQAAAGPCASCGRRTEIDHEARFGLVQTLEALIDEQTRGDPESALRWICKSTRSIAGELLEQDHPVSHMKVAQILHDLNYSLQGNRKTEEGADHPDRDAQFRHINATVKRCLGQGIPVISVDTKKKELLGNYDNAGQQWLPAKHPLKVQGHDFPSPTVPRAYPYGNPLYWSQCRFRQCRDRPRHRRLCGGLHPRLVAFGGSTHLPAGDIDSHHRRRW